MDAAAVAATQYALSPADVYSAASVGGNVLTPSCSYNFAAMAAAARSNQNTAVDPYSTGYVGYAGNYSAGCDMIKQEQLNDAVSQPTVCEGTMYPGGQSASPVANDCSPDLLRNTLDYATARRLASSQHLSKRCAESPLSGFATPSYHQHQQQQHCLTNSVNMMSM